MARILFNYDPPHTNLTLREGETMGKRENENKQRQGENSPEQKKNEDMNTQNPKGVIVLGVYIHCEGCENSVVKCLRGFDGVEVIEVDAKNHKVTVKGKKADPLKVAERVRKKTNKHVDLISPIIKKKEEKKEVKKKEPKIVQVLLKIYMHCEGCAHDIKHRIHKMQGVQSVEADMAKSQVSVRGAFEPEKLVEYINKRAGKYAVILKQTTEKEKKDDEIARDKNEDYRRSNPYPYPYPNYPHQLVYAPQLFSDENANSCSVM